jgi:hypothetical protein
MVLAPLVACEAISVLLWLFISIQEAPTIKTETATIIAITAITIFLLNLDINEHLPNFSLVVFVFSFGDIIPH